MESTRSEYRMHRVVNPGNSLSFFVRYVNEVLVSSPRGGHLRVLWK